MWNYSYIFPSFLILIVFASYCLYIPRINIGMNRVYLQLILVEGIVMIMDIISSMADERYADFTVGQLYFLNDLYFITFFIRSYLFYVLTSYILKAHHFFQNKLQLLSIIPVVIALVITVSGRFTNLIYAITEEGYRAGPLYDYVVYSCIGFYVCISLVMVIIRRKNLLNKTDFAGAIGYNMTLALGIVLRKTFPTLLLLDTFCLIALIIIYLSFTNPDFFYNLRYSAFNTNALRYYVDEIRSYKDHRYIAFGIHNYTEMRGVYGAVEMDKALNLIGQYLRNTFKDLISFYHREGRFILVGAGDIDSSRIIGDINRRFKEPWILKETEMYFELDFVQTAKEMTIESPEKRLDAVLAVLRDKAKPVPGAVYYVQDAEIEQNEREMYIRKTLKWVTENELTEVYLQPIVRADTRKIVGAEALARIKDKDGNRIMPGEFIPVAEQNGAINQMGEQVLKKTCKYIKDNDIEKMGITWINVNLSPMQFMNYGLAEKYNSIVEESGIDVGLIHLEITEEAMVDQMVLFRQIQIMKESGFKFVLDDYGKGYSNLDRLKKIPFINVKIDMAIVRDYCNSPDSLLPSMVQTFKHMGFTLTAEGIETKEMADEMQRIGCDYLQGYLFSPPVPVEEFEEKCAKLANTK